MIAKILISNLLVFILFAISAIKAQNEPYIHPISKDYVKVRGLNMGDVRWTDGFWKERFDLCMKNVVPSEWSYFMNFSEDNFKKSCGEMALGDGCLGTNWQDGDYYKWLEAQVAVYSITKDPKLLKTIEERVNLIVRAQASDGYITMHTQIGFGLGRSSSSLTVK